MQNVNATLLSTIDASLAKAQREHDLMAKVIGAADEKSVALQRVYPHGYCADASIELLGKPEGRTLKELVFDVFKPVQSVYVFAQGVAATVKPLAYLRDSERTNANVLPAFPVLTKSLGTSTSIRWWTIVAGKMVEVSLDVQHFDNAEFSALMEGWGPVHPESIHYATGTSTFYYKGYKPAANAVELPLLKLQQELARFDSALLNVAWAWRSHGVEATQKSLDGFVASKATKNPRLADAEQAEILRVQEQMAQRYLPLALETDAMLNKCADALTQLFEQKGLPELTPKAMEHLKQYLAESVGVVVPSLSIRRGTNHAIYMELGLKSRSWFAPLERSIPPLANKSILRLQDIPVTYEVDPVN